MSLSVLEKVGHSGLSFHCWLRAPLTVLDENRSVHHLLVHTQTHQLATLTAPFAQLISP